MKKVRLIVVGVVLTFVSVVFTSCTNSEDYDPVLTEIVETAPDDPKSDGEDEKEEGEEGAGSGTGTNGPG